jgi:phosphoglycerate kinase
MSAFKSLTALAARGKTVVVRADLNVPMHDGQVSDLTRITRFVPTLQHLSAQGAACVVLSHFGRPKGRDLSQSLAPLAPVLAAESGLTVHFVNDCIGDEVVKRARELKPGEVLLCDNLRFHAEEESNDLAFAKKLAALGDVYVNDAFSCAHRAHASTEALARLLPAYAGLLMEEELRALDAALENPARPVMAIVGGAKISTKLDLLGNLVEKVDVLVLGGGMANTFLAAQGYAVGTSLCEHDMLDQARKISAKAAAWGCRLLLPVDGLMAKIFAANADYVTTSTQEIPQDRMMLDIGPASVAEIIATLSTVKTVLWNGPLGAFELSPFDSGTTAVARSVASAVAASGLIAVAGGGDTVAALAHAGVVDKMTYVSSAGGAFLEWLEGKTLPGVAALQA